MFLLFRYVWILVLVVTCPIVRIHFDSFPRVAISNFARASANCVLCVFWWISRVLQGPIAWHVKTNHLIRIFFQGKSAKTPCLTPTVWSCDSVTLWTVQASQRLETCWLKSVGAANPPNGGFLRFGVQKNGFQYQDGPMTWMIWGTSIGNPPMAADGCACEAEGITMENRIHLSST